MSAQVVSAGLGVLFLRVARLPDNSVWDMLFYGASGIGLVVYSLAILVGLT